MERIESEVVIERPASAIFAYLSDAKNWPEFNSLVLEASAPDTPIRKGSRVKAVGKVLGRRVEAISEITEYEPSRTLSTHVTWPGMVFDDTWTFEPAAGRTHVRYVADAESRGFFKLADPIVARIVQKQWDSILAALKEILEAEVPAAVVV